MTTEELLDKLNEIQINRCETQMVELKCAQKGCPKRLYDTLSSFSNQDDGGVIYFGIDEEHGYQETGVYDPQDIQKKINEQCLQMEPVVRPLLTVVEKDGKFFVSAEIPGIELSCRPCYYKGQGQVKGSYVRVGDSDEPMTAYEIYSYEAFRKKYQDDVRSVPRAELSSLDTDRLEEYIRRLRIGKPNLSRIPEDEICELMSVTRDRQVTLNAIMLFSPYPQAYFPQLCITAVSIMGTTMGELGEMGERFLDNQRIEGTIPEMLDGAIQFVRKNMKTKTIVDPTSGKRKDVVEYPITAVREVIVNALVHRDYSIHTEGMPIQLLMYEDRLEVRSPGGIYGRLRVDQLGKVQPDTRNPVLATALETLGITENRYSGIPTVRRALADHHLAEPEFLDERGCFIVRFFKEIQQTVLEREQEELIEFCQVPRNRKEICAFLGLSSVTYAIQAHVLPLVERGLLHLSVPEKPRSRNQLYYAKPRGN